MTNHKLQPKNGGWWTKKETAEKKIESLMTLY